MAETLRYIRLNTQTILGCVYLENFFNYIALLYSQLNLVVTMNDPAAQTVKLKPDAGFFLTISD